MRAEAVSAIGNHCRLFARALWEACGFLYSRHSLGRRMYERVKPYAFPSHVRRVLIVCKGNICRSPLAAAYLSWKMKQAGGHVTVASAGLETTPGKPAHELALQVAGESEIQLHDHRTSTVTSHQIEELDLILVMEIAQMDRLKRLYPQAADKIALLGYFDRSGGGVEISDPYGRDIVKFRNCFARIRSCSDALAIKIMENQ